MSRGEGWKLLLASAGLDSEVSDWSAVAGFADPGWTRSLVSAGTTGLTPLILTWSVTLQADRLGFIFVAEAGF